MQAQLLARLGSPRRARLLALVVAAALVAAGAGFVALKRAQEAIAATAVSCGQEITTSIVVGNDLDNCPGFGLVVGKAGITVNLNGHTIDGSGPESGIHIPPPFNGVVITNGSITDFANGVRMGFGTSANTVKALRVSSNTSQGIVALGDRHKIIANTVFENSSQGIGVVGDRNAIANNTVTSNGLSGIEVQSGSANVVQGNRALANRLGIMVVNAATKTTLTANIANGNDFDGFIVGDPLAKLTSNTASFNTELGFKTVGGVSDGGGNKVRDNGAQHQCEDIVCS